MKPKKIDILPDSGESSKEEEEPPSLIKSLVSKGSFLMPQDGVATLFYPYLFQNTLTQNQQSYYHTNGHTSLLKSLRVEVVSHLDKCRKLWEKFSPKITLFDTWDFRLAFWKGYRHEPHFIFLKNDQEEYGLLPLWFEKDKRRYTWFGSTWQEENRFFVKDPLFIPLLLAICPSRVILNAISTEMPSWINKVIRLKPDDPKFILKLDSIKSADDYLSTLKKKKRYNFKRDRRIIEAQKPKITIDNFSDFETLVNLSIKRFAQKGEDTDWEDPRRMTTFRQIVKSGQGRGDYKIRMITVAIGKRIAAVDLVALFNGCYYPLKCGYDVSNFPGIGNYVNLFEIDDAVSLGMKKMDFLEIGYGWKEKWFENVPLLQYEKK